MKTTMEINSKTNNEKGMMYLHGDLDLHIIEARCLPNMDLFSENFRRIFSSCRVRFPKKRSSNKKGKNHGPDLKKQHSKKIITSDPYVTVNIGGATVARTRVISNCQSPKWEEHFSIPLAHCAVTDIEFKVKDNDVFGADMIGIATVLASSIASGKEIDDWFPILRDNGKPPKPNAALHLRLRFIPCGATQGNADGDHRVRRSYFPERPGGRVTLYQDAHVADNELPKIELEQGVEFQQGKCWEDICHAISEAHHLVYIVGWSVYHKVRLVREPTPGKTQLPNGGDLSLGELLKYKSQEGVRVLLLVWDDKTSHSKFFINTEGVMQTHDEQTRKFFKHSSVICTLSPRYASSKLSIIKQQACFCCILLFLTMLVSLQVVGTLYTHHQKCVIVDTQASGNNRKITAFLGGLDLCDGRYDTPGHRLFRDLDTVFHNDCHNPTLDGTKGPREPWHDLHCKIEGPAAYDVLTNFEQRWRKATRSSLRRKIKSISHWHDDALLKIDRISWILSPSKCISPDDKSLWACEENDTEGWQVQVFRSIDSGSVEGFPKDVQMAESQNLVCAKDLVIDRSIQTAYIEAIRSAQHFIYIENQYFLGSSYAWPNYKHAGADHLIPMELALKIASKIRAKERFAVYVVIPMWPEGVPTSASVQEILFWQGETMQMMYSIIAKEIKAMNLKDVHPQDYLNFYCLGNREPPLDLTDSGQQISKNGDGPILTNGQWLVQETLRLLWVLINPITLGVYGYRMSLWAEHLGGLDDLFKEAENLECVRTVSNIADENWKKFVADDYSPLQGHLLRYPVHVCRDGKVHSLRGHEHFPDVGGKVLGAANSIPDALTT
ncbi:Phospholipase D delta [Bienertia sinuspersici]